jgi:hypothetical protein
MFLITYCILLIENVSTIRSEQSHYLLFFHYNAKGLPNGGPFNFYKGNTFPSNKYVLLNHQLMKLIAKLYNVNTSF